MNILYFAPVQLYPDGHGNIATVRAYIKYLRQSGHRVHYVLFAVKKWYKAFNLFYQQKFVDTLDVINQTVHGVRTQDGNYVFDSMYQDGLGEKIRELCRVYNIDAVICTYVMQSKLLEYVPDNVLKILDTHDRMSDRAQALQKNHIKDEFFSCTNEDEGRYLSRADIVWARRDEETKFFNDTMGVNKAITVSHFSEPHYLNKNTKQLRSVGFLASDNNVNLKCVQEFIDAFVKNKKVMQSGIEVIIGGNIKNLLEQDTDRMEKIKDTNIKLVGKIPDLVDFYRMVDAVIVPITFGTGINIKMVLDEKAACMYGVIHMLYHTFLCMTMAYIDLLILMQAHIVCINLDLLHAH